MAKVLVDGYIYTQNQIHVRNLSKLPLNVVICMAYYNLSRLGRHKGLYSHSPVMCRVQLPWKDPLVHLLRYAVYMIHPQILVSPMEHPWIWLFPYINSFTKYFHQLIKVLECFHVGQRKLHIRGQIFELVGDINVRLCCQIFVQEHWNFTVHQIVLTMLTKCFSGILVIYNIHQH